MLTSSKENHFARSKTARKPGRTKTGATDRLHVSLPEELNERLEQMKTETFASSIGEVIKNALIVYAALLEEHKRGRDVFTQGKNGADAHKMMIFL